jgi:hypothetical protein
MPIKVGLGWATSQSDAACKAYVVDRGTKMRLTLEMRSPAQLVRAAPDARIRFREVEDNDQLLVRIFHEVGDPHLWSAQSSASHWPNARLRPGSCGGLVSERISQSGLACRHGRRRDNCGS